MKLISAYTVTLLLVFPFLASAQNSSDDLAMATLNEKMETLGDEMEGLGKIMETYGTEMEKYGKEIEKNPGHSPKTEKQMEELGDKMSELGEQMGKLGEQMGQYGEKMGVIHRQMVDWFFREMKKDGLISSLNGKARIIFDEKGLSVDGNKASDDQARKYKLGLEKYWGRPLKTDFLFFFKGTLHEKDGKIDTDGTMNTDF